MRYPILAAVLLASAACGQPPALDQQPATSTPATTAATSPEAPRARRAGDVDGWETDVAAFAAIGTTFPAFSATLADKTELTQNTLRGHWTIVGFIGGPGGGRNEGSYASALVSAADQDPDLDVIWALTDPSASSVGSAPTINATELAKTLGIEQTPAYLLVGPDLTIEGHRGALSATPDNGIKPIIRGVAQIRKQISAPE